MYFISDFKLLQISFLNLNKILLKIQKNNFVPKSKFQNKIIIQQQDAELQKVLQYISK
jgi:hypothetical protein